MRISVAGVAERDGKFLVAKRMPGTSIGEKWEFPGGKSEKGETPEQALVREYHEELGIGVKVGRLLYEGGFSNGIKKYHLMAFCVELESDEFITPEHQKIIWADRDTLKDLDFPASDMMIVDHILSQ